MSSRDRESNPVFLAFMTSALPLSYSTTNEMTMHIMWMLSTSPQLPLSEWLRSACVGLSVAVQGPSLGHSTRLLTGFRTAYHVRQVVVCMRRECLARLVVRKEAAGEHSHPVDCAMYDTVFGTEQAMQCQVKVKAETGNRTPYLSLS
ncbi:unnamed protein product [Orchesella dallaii]|uniref:Uncharacterized protein n=1 Tax=Orchesella dallaii TaxID=48710 RepID=A0ABP1Q7C6_9HEXA